MPIPVQIALTVRDVIEEIQKIKDDMNSRTAHLDGDALERAQTIQGVALGTIFFNQMRVLSDEYDEDVIMQMMVHAHQLGNELYAFARGEDVKATPFVDFRPKGAKS